MIVNNTSSPGIAIQASTNRCTVKSTRPPKNPEVPPIRVATTTFRAVAARPTVNESRAPWMRRLNKSRPIWSVPIRCRNDEPCILSIKFISANLYGAN